MGQQRVKEYGEEKKEEKKEEKEKPKVSKERVVKKWKGKDWFAILAPKSFGENIIAETPATDPKTLMGRVVEVTITDLLGQRGKDYQKLRFKIDKIDDNKACTKFSGYVTVKEFISRVIRKRLQKIEIIGNVKTRDEWVLQISSIAVMNRNVERNIQRKVRLWVENLLSETAGRSGIDDFVKFIVAGSIQHKIKKQGSKIYPVRFFEVSKIEVMREPEK